MDKINVILCFPPKRDYPGYGQDRRWFPLGIASIGAFLKSRSKDFPGELNVCCLDLFNLSYDEAAERIKENIIESNKVINIIGFTCLTEQRISVFELCKLFKTYEDLIEPGCAKTQIKTVIGGAHAFSMAKQISEHYKEVDHIIKGEGENAFYSIVKTYFEDEIPEKILQFPNESSLNTFPHAVDGLTLFDKIPEFSEAPIIFSRGCTDLCTFCNTTMFWKGYRSRNFIDVFSEMEKYYKQYGVSKFKFHDDACTADIENLKKLCKLIIDEGYKWEFELTARADQFDDELIVLLKKAGCYQVAIGIESGNEGLRKAMNKKLDIDEAKKNIKKLKAAKIRVGILLIVAYLGESDFTIRDTVNFIKETKPDIVFTQPLMIFPGTIVYKRCKEKGIIDDDYWLEDRPQPYYTFEQNWNTINEWTRKIQKAGLPKTIMLVVPVRQKESIFKKHIDALNKLEIPEGVNLIRYFIFHNSDNLIKYINHNDSRSIVHSSEEYKTDGKTHEWKSVNLQNITAIKQAVIDINLLTKFNVDYIFWVDSDLVVQKETLKSLYEADKKIISEIFWTDWNMTGHEEPNAWDFDHYSFFQGTQDKYKKPGVYQCGGTGACILVDCDVYRSGVSYLPLKNVSFWGEDRAFSIRAECAGFDMFVDTKYPAKHLYREE